jgi:molybdenum cofactor cytidylyltransferase
MIYGVLLAAGSSSRMGRPKQLLRWQGRALVRHAAEVALASRLDGLVVVLGAAAAEVRAALAGLEGPVALAHCADHAEGQAASLRAGLAALPAATQAAVVLLVDMPLVTPRVIDALIAAHEAEPEALAVIPRHGGRRGNPTLLTAPLFPELRALRGDTGARGVLEHHAPRLRWLDTDDPAVVTDLDTPEAYQALTGHNKGEGQGEPGSP